MRTYKLPILAFMSLSFMGLVGCNETTGYSNDAIIASSESASNHSARTGVDAGPISIYTEVQNDGGSYTELFKDCPLGSVLTGFGAHVKNHNFAGVTVHCRTINSDGSLGSQSAYSAGTSIQEQQRFLPTNMVAVGLGGTVTDDNIYKIVIEGCLWDPSSRSIDFGNCQTFSSFKDINSEKFFGIEDVAESSNRAKAVLTGAGMTSSHDNLRQIRITIGTIR